jgi:hypothetical protein
MTRVTQPVPKSKKPKVEIKRQKVSLGWAYRIYIGGMYMGTGLTRASARESVPRMLAIYERMNEPRAPRRSQLVAPQRAAADGQRTHAVFAHVAQGHHFAVPIKSSTQTSTQ